MTIKYLDSKRISALAYELNAYTTESAYDTTGVTYGAESNVSATGTRRGIKILSGSSAIGKIIRKVSTQMRGVSSPTGNLTFKVYRSGSAISTSNTLDVSTLTSSFVLKELTLDTKVILQADDRVVAEYTDATGSMAVHFLYNNSPSTIASGFEHTGWNGSAWSDITYDLMFAFDSTPATYTNPTGDVKPTNVETNSILVEKDTGIRRWFNGTTWTANPTYTGSSVTEVTSGGYKYIKFLDDGTLNTQGLDVEVLVVGGGGGGGQWSAGGGAGGAVLLTDSFTPTSGSLTVTVGAGGLKGGGGLTGGNSSYDSNIAGGGGGGAAHAGGSGTGGTGGNSGGSGGSGQHVAGGGGGSGGASLKAGVTGYTSTNHTGGAGSAQHFGGGGGGAGAGGSNSTTSAGGNGVGGSSYTALNSFLSNSSTGVEETSGNWWVGGAAGGGRLNGGAAHAGTGTSGKGGAGNGSAGVANTGGGGSNHAWDGGNFNGGSGIVVVRHTV